jgi:hypothetical protein
LNWEKGVVDADQCKVIDGQGVTIFNQREVVDRLRAAHLDWCERNE